MGDFPIRFNPVNALHGKKLQPITLDYIVQLKEDLRKLVEVIGPNINFEISGGLAIPLTLERHLEETKDLFPFPFPEHRIYRPHHAFHLSIHATQFQKLKDRFAKTEKTPEKYKLVQQKASIHGWKIGEDWKADTYWGIEPKEATEERKDNLRFVRRRYDGKLATPHQSRLDYIDIYPYIFQNAEREEVSPWFNDRFAIVKEGRVFSEDEVWVMSWDKKETRLQYIAYKGEIYSHFGTKINLAGLSWIKLIKESRQKIDEADKFDIDLINKAQKLIPRSYQ